MGWRGLRTEGRDGFQGRRSDASEKFDREGGGEGTLAVELFDEAAFKKHRLPPVHLFGLYNSISFRNCS